MLQFFPITDCLHEIALLLHCRRWQMRNILSHIKWLEMIENINFTGNRCDGHSKYDERERFEQITSQFIHLWSNFTCATLTSYSSVWLFVHLMHCALGVIPMAMTRHRNFRAYYNSRHTRLALNRRLKEVLICFSTRKPFKTRRGEEITWNVNFL